MAKKTSGLKLKYFVLKPKGRNAYAIASRRAMLEFSRAIASEDPVLAQGLRDWVEREEPPVPTMSNEYGRG